MSDSLKRRLSNANRSVSPPSLRRRRTGKDIDSAGRRASVSTGEDTLVIYSWNVNGIRPLLQKRINFTKDNTYPLRAFLKSHQWPDVLCLQEVKISKTDEKTQQQVELAANAGSKPDEPTYTTVFSLPRDKHNATGFGGKVHGVASLIRDGGRNSNMVTSEPAWDLEGRVLIHELQSLPLVVVNGYWVNGTTNPYRNVVTGVVEGTRHDHKLRFHKHMFDLCKSVEQSGRSFILIGDMNVAPFKIDGHPNLRVNPIQHVLNRADFNSKFFGISSQEGLGAIDAFRHFHGNERRFTYHGRGRPWGESCDRVDLVMASRSLTEMDAMTGSDICDTPQERGHSDHVPLWVSVDALKLGAARHLAEHEAGADDDECQVTHDGALVVND